MLFEWSNARDGSACAVAVASSLTRMGGDHERPPSEDMVKSTSSPVVDPDQPAKARYTTPLVPAAIEGDGPKNEARYTGGTSICTFGPMCGAAGAAATDGVRNARRATARRAVTTPIGIVRRARDTNRAGVRTIGSAPKPPAVLTRLFNRRGPGIEIENKSGGRRP